MAEAKGHVAEVQFPWRSMGYQVEVGDIGIGRDRRRYLLNSILIRRQNHHISVECNPSSELLRVVNTGIDKDDGFNLACHDSHPKNVLCSS